MITAVIFDYGGTMTARFESEYILIARFFGVDPEEAREKTQESIHDFQRGKMTEEGFLLLLRNGFKPVLYFPCYFKVVRLLHRMSPCPFLARASS